MFKELGYYTCDGKIFETKLQAMLYANPKNLSITWHFNDHIYNSYNWQIEPIESLDVLYDRRAKQIREQYDYVILSYSGGSDSNNILESFLRQGLFIDEIITNWALDATSNYIQHDASVKETWNNNAEYKLNTIHRLQDITNRSPRTKITVMDTSKIIVDSLLDNQNAEWVYGKNDVFNVTGAFNYNIIYNKELRKRFDKLGKVAYVLGIEKPKLTIINNDLYLFFIDKATSMIPIIDHVKDYSNITPILFYWSPDTTDLICKQAHTVLKHIRSSEPIKAIWKSSDVVVRRRVQEELLKTMIYSTWNREWFQVLKTTQDWNSELDYWFTKGWSDTKEYSIWLDGLKNLVPKISNFIVNEKQGRNIGTKPFFSKFYKIGSVE